ncbi:GH3 auxin-responsive promoter family protein [Flavobacteriales bacterium]|nr:GH3 auxin-responsive promoter family protein [Flavobacteriales bacterium]
MPKSTHGGWKGWIAKPLAMRVQKDDWDRSADPARAQAKVLASLLQSAVDTVFGQDHGLASVAAIQDPGQQAQAFREAVPVRDYEGLRPYVDRVVAGEPDVLWPGLPKYFCKTSGTTSGAKYIPLTEDSLSNHIGSARRALLHHVAKSWPEEGSDCFAVQRDAESFRAKWVMLQNKNRMVNELAIALITFTAVAAYSAGTNIENKRASNMNIGAPGGCPTSSL